MDIKSARFIKSSVNLEQCPDDGTSEFAFIGRSNVGKSSLINMLVNKKNLAKTSGKPGKTQHINHFLINEHWYIVDLPGYGWSKVSKKQKAEWGVMIEDYLLKRSQLSCLFVLIDGRLEPQEIDYNFIEWLGEKEIPFTIVYTKTDKLSHNKLSSVLARHKRKLTETWEELPPIFVTSAVNKTGKEEFLKFLDEVINIT